MMPVGLYSRYRRRLSKYVCCTMPCTTPNTYGVSPPCTVSRLYVDDVKAFLPQLTSYQRMFAIFVNNLTASFVGMFRYAVGLSNTKVPAVINLFCHLRASYL